MSWLRHPALHWGMGIALGCVFLYACYDKILHPAEFAKIVYHYQAIGPSRSIPPLVPNLVAIALPWVEALVGLGLVLGIWRREAASLAAALLVVFVLAVSSALVRGIDIQNCGCFSVSAEGRRAGAKLILGDLAMLAGALILTREPLGAQAAARSTQANPAREPA